MTQQHLNNVMLLNVHKDLTDALDKVNIGRQFVGASKEFKKSQLLGAS